MNGEHSFPDFTRAQLINDAINLARFGHLSYEIALDLISYLKAEINFMPWAAAVNSFAYFESSLRNDSLKNWNEYVLSLLEKVLRKEGFDDNCTHISKILRMSIWKYACEHGHKLCEKKARELHSSFEKFNTYNNKSSSVNLRSALMCTAVRLGTESHWAAIFDKYANSILPSENEILLSALSCSNNTDTLNNYLRMSLSTQSRIKKQDFATVLEAVSASTKGAPVVYNILINNFTDVINHIPDFQINLLNRVLPVLIQKVNVEEITEIKNLINQTTSSAVKSIIQQYAEIAEDKIKGSPEEKISNWIESMKNNTIPTQPPITETTPNSVNATTNSTTSNRTSESTTIKSISDPTTINTTSIPCTTSNHPTTNTSNRSTTSLPLLLTTVILSTPGPGKKSSGLPSLITSKLLVPLLFLINAMTVL